MKNRLLNVVSLIVGLLISPLSVESIELVIGEERIEPGIVAIFEGAIKDHIHPKSLHLQEELTEIHIEARVNWDKKNIPEGTPSGGFVPYLRITALVTNQKTGLRTFVDLLPHINLIDNFHYARNIALPGNPKELYSVEFNLIPPADVELALHRDWAVSFGGSLFKAVEFKYTDVDFSEIASASRR
jgi:uncharacterized protein involved in high-affinity Fe2+ transport